VGGIGGLLGGGNLFNQNTYSQQMYNNLTAGGKQYAESIIRTWWSSTRIQSI
jgi:hypothetical protein